MGLAVTADGKRLVVANYENDPSVCWTSLGVKFWPNWTFVLATAWREGSTRCGWPVQGSSTAFVSSARDREILVVDISTKLAGDYEPHFVKGQPTRIALNPKQTRLYVAESSSDSVVS